MLSEKVIKNKAREFRQGGKDMRIAMLTNNYRPFVGGVPISVERQAEELIKLGHQVTVFAPMYGETQEEREAVLAADVSAPEQVVRYGTQKRKMDNGMVYPSFYPSEIMEACTSSDVRRTVRSLSETKIQTAAYLYISYEI